MLITHLHTQRSIHPEVAQKLLALPSLHSVLPITRGKTHAPSSASHSASQHNLSNASVRIGAGMVWKQL